MDHFHNDVTWAKVSGSCSKKGTDKIHDWLSTTPIHLISLKRLARQEVSNTGDLLSSQTIF